MVKIIDVSVFGAMGDWKSDVEKTHKKICQLFQLTNYFLFLKLSKSVHGARRTVCTKPIGKLGGPPGIADSPLFQRSYGKIIQSSIINH